MYYQSGRLLDVFALPTRLFCSTRYLFPKFPQSPIQFSCPLYFFFVSSLFTCWKGSIKATCQPRLQGSFSSIAIFSLAFALSLSRCVPFALIHYLFYFSWYIIHTLGPFASRLQRVDTICMYIYLIYIQRLRKATSQPDCVIQITTSPAILLNSLRGPYPPQPRAIGRLFYFIGSLQRLPPPSTVITVFLTCRLVRP
ncbi:hypothetical protein BJX62DRAFT_157215 [Aspergillus germanicus]